MRRALQTDMQHVYCALCLMSRTASAANGAGRQATAHQVLFRSGSSAPRERQVPVLALQNFLCAEGSICGKEVCGAWMVMVEVSVQDPAAPSWEFLQVRCPQPESTDSVRLQILHCMCLSVMLMTMMIRGKY